MQEQKEDNNFQINNTTNKSAVEELLLENEELLCEIMMGMKCRKNKNLIQPKISILIHRF